MMFLVKVLPSETKIFSLAYSIHITTFHTVSQYTAQAAGFYHTAGAMRNARE